MGAEMVPQGAWASESEVAALEAGAARLRDEVLELEREVAVLETELREFRAARAYALGRLYAELDELDARLAEALWSRRPRDEVLKIRAATTRTRARASAEHAAAQRQPPPPRPPPSPTLHTAYLAAARRFHPDLGHGQEQDVRHRYMVLLNEAFERRDELEIEALVDDWASNAVREVTPNRESRRSYALRVLGRLRATHQRLSDELRSLRDSPEHGLMVAARQPDGGLQLDALEHDLRVRIALARERLAALRGEHGRDA